MSYLETFDLDAPPTAVFDALLNHQTAQRWLAEQVRIDPVKGGVFRFWGRDVIWCAREDETEGQILDLDRPHLLELSWRWKGHTTRISFRIEGDSSGSRLSVEHHFESFDPGENGPGPDMASCHWRIAIGNLTSLLATGQSSLRPDYTLPAKEGRQRVELEIEIDAPPERVFQALLDPAKVQVWMQVETPEIDQIASRYSYGWRRGEAATEVGPARILEIVPNRRLVHDWHWVGEPDGQVCWELSPTERGTMLRLIHTESWDYTHTLGWSDALVRIRQLFEQG